MLYPLEPFKLNRPGGLAAFLCLLALLAGLYSCSRGSERGVPIDILEMREIGIYLPSGTGKFGSEYLYSIKDPQKLNVFRHVLSHLDASPEIERVKDISGLLEGEYAARMDARPIFIQKEDGAGQASCRLLHLLIGDANGNSYLIFTGTEIGYLLREPYTEAFLAMHLSQYRQGA